MSETTTEVTHRHHVRITADDIYPHTVVVELDGEPVDRITDLRLHLGADQCNQVTLTFEAAVDVDLPASVRRTLSAEQLGALEDAARWLEDDPSNPRDTVAMVREITAQLGGTDADA